MDKPAITKGDVLLAVVIMILAVLLFGSPIKRRVQVETAGDREAWREGRIDRKSDNALTEQTKKAVSVLAFTS